MLAAVLAAAAAAAGPVSGAGARGASDRPRPLTVQSDGLFVRAAQGSYCITRRSGDGWVRQCADYAYPLRVRGLLPVGAGERMTLNFHDHAIRRVRLALLHVDGAAVERVPAELRAHQDRRHPVRWTARLPAAAADANRLDIKVRYERGLGDSEWWVGLDPGR